MRDYGRVYATFWSSSTTCPLSDDGKLLALYLMTCAHSTITGVFRLPDGYVAEDLHWGVERVRQGFAELLFKGFANRCETTKWVWVCKHLEWNKPENPNQRKSAAKIAASIPDECEWKPDFMRVCGESLGLDVSAYSNGSATVEQPLLNQKTEAVTGTEAGESPATPDGIAPPAEQIEVESKAKASKARKVTFAVFCESCRAAGEKIVSDYEPVWTFADSVGIPAEWIELAWWRFKDRYLNDPNNSGKLYTDWRKTFLNAIRDDWFHLWIVSAGKPATLTSRGEAARLEFEAETHREAA